MRRWRKDKEEDDDEELTFEDLDDEDKKVPYRRPEPRHINMKFGNDEEESGPTFDELEAKIRAGKYKPKSKDPWNAHVLYQTLKDLGEI